MVDYRNLRERRARPTPINPIEIFRRLPKTEKIKDLFEIQRHALQDWFQRRDEKDIVIKLNTGGGKTLVGLLIAQSIMNEHRGPVLYLCPNRQLVSQALDKAAEIGVSATAYSGRVDNPEFRNGQAVMVATYHALFNGQSKFGLRGRREVVRVEGIVVDDAHAALPVIRQQFTLSVSAESMRDVYTDLVGLFRGDFADIGKSGTFDDIVQGQDPGVLEVPYWGWKTKIEAVRQILTETDHKRTSEGSAEEWTDYVFAWPLLRDELDVCHALISSWDFSITPIYPIVDLFPTFVECPRRIYMSATLADDSAIIRTFNTAQQSVSQPVMPVETTNVGERMILVPALTGIDPGEQIHWAKKLVDLVSSRSAGIVILVPSYRAAMEWADVGTIVLREEVERCIEELQKARSIGPYVFANRYDGIDLPGDSCRLLILAGLPKGIDSYDTYLGSVLGESGAIQTTRAQRIEQGAGRSTRGAGDFSVVLFVGNDLSAWIGTSSNLKLLTPVTRAQFEMGIEISKAIDSVGGLIRTLLQCLDQDSGWRRYHAETLAELAEPIPVDAAALTVAASERHFFRLLRERRFNDAVSVLEELVQNDAIEDRKYIGWLLQLAARAAYLGGLENKARGLQERAFGANRTLLHTKEGPIYMALTPPGEQASAIVEQIVSYKHRKSYLAHFEDVVSDLSPNVSSNQFEEALRNLGIMLGFQAQRPEHEFGKGPDVLWLFDDHVGLAMEVKSRKDPKNPLTKAEHGQLLSSFEWFKQEYPSYQGIKVSVHPTALASQSFVTTDTMVLTLRSLASLTACARELLSELCGSNDPREALKVRCEARLGKLSPQQLCDEFLQPLQHSD
jgi:replicative superfamily II helicase